MKDHQMRIHGAEDFRLNISRRIEPSEDRFNTARRRLIFNSGLRVEYNNALIIISSSLLSSSLSPSLDVFQIAFLTRFSGANSQARLIHREEDRLHGILNHQSRTRVFLH